MKYTKKQRKKIYEIALDLLASSEFLTEAVETIAQYDRYVCHAVKHAVRLEFGHVIDHEIVKFHFPEAYAFRSNEYNSIWLSEYEDGEFWFDPDTEEGNELRKTVLAFAMVLCGDADFQNDLKLT
jgi:hypothetical protein